jgi:hypothetical protein
LRGVDQQTVEQRIAAVEAQNALLVRMLANLTDRFDRVFRCDKADL